MTGATLAAGNDQADNQNCEDHAADDPARGQMARRESI
jgi:hypothetical protein